MRNISDARFQPRNSRSSKKTSTRSIRVELLKIKDQEKMLKPARKKREISPLKEQYE